MVGAKTGRTNRNLRDLPTPDRDAALALSKEARSQKAIAERSKKTGKDPRNKYESIAHLPVDEQNRRRLEQSRVWKQNDRLKAANKAHLSIQTNVSMPSSQTNLDTSARSPSMFETERKMRARQPPSEAQKKREDSHPSVYQTFEVATVAVTGGVEAVNRMKLLKSLKKKDSGFSDDNEKEHTPSSHTTNSSVKAKGKTPHVAQALSGEAMSKTEHGSEKDLEESYSDGDERSRASLRHVYRENDFEESGSSFDEDSPTAFHRRNDQEAPFTPENAGIVTAEDIHRTIKKGMDEIAQIKADDARTASKADAQLEELFAAKEDDVKAMKAAQAEADKEFYDSMKYLHESKMARTKTDLDIAIAEKDKMTAIILQEKDKDLKRSEKTIDAWNTAMKTQVFAYSQSQSSYKPMSERDVVRKQQGKVGPEMYVNLVDQGGSSPLVDPLESPSSVQNEKSGTARNLRETAYEQKKTEEGIETFYGDIRGNSVSNVRGTAYEEEKTEEDFANIRGDIDSNPGGDHGGNIVSNDPDGRYFERPAPVTSTKKKKKKRRKSSLEKVASAVKSVVKKVTFNQKKEVVVFDRAMLTEDEQLWIENFNATESKEQGAYPWRDDLIQAYRMGLIDYLENVHLVDVVRKAFSTYNGSQKKWRTSGPLLKKQLKAFLEEQYGQKGEGQQV